LNISELCYLIPLGTNRKEEGLRCSKATKGKSRKAFEVVRNEEEREKGSMYQLCD